MKRYLLSVFLFLLGTTLYAQLYSGPAAGSVASGVLVNTSTFLESSMPVRHELQVHNKAVMQIDADYIPGLNKAGMKEQIYVTDPSTLGKEVTTGDNILIKSFPGQPQGNSIPPDPYLAVGPQHIMGLVNTTFGIWDKNGNKLKSIDINAWYASAFSGVSAFDPKVLYDQYAKRWVMVWLDQAASPARGNILISVSKDSSAIGEWYNYVFNAGLNGATASNTWTDYQGIGYDKDAIYVTGNQWDFATSNTFQYAKVRIIPKSALYAHTGGPVGYFDIWDIRYPQSLTSKIFGVRPVRMVTEATNEYYLVQMNQNGANYVVVYKLKNVTTAPTMTGSVITMTSYAVAPNANQLGGGTPLIEGGGSGLRNEPIYRDGYLFVTHAIRNPSNASYSSLHYFSVDLTSNIISEDYALGASGYFYFYPSLATDKVGSSVLTFSRSGDNEYAGAFYVSRRMFDAGFSPAKAIAPGLGNYVKTFGGTRNRWGDYTGAWVDPSNDYDIWLLSEYAAGVNTWGTYIAQVRVTPYAGATLNSTPNLVQFAPVEVGNSSPLLNAGILNTGSIDIRIDSMKFNRSELKVLSIPTLPITVQSFDSLNFKVQFKPTAYETVKDTLQIYTDQGTFKVVPVQAKGYTITPAPATTLFAVSNDGKVISINKNTASATSVGLSGYSSLGGLTVHPKTKNLYAVRTNEQSQTEILRVSATTGEAFVHATVALNGVSSIAFDTTGLLYIAMKTGVMYSFNTVTKELLYADSVKSQLSAIAVNQLTNQMYGAVLKIIGAGKDKIFKINVATGDTTNVGNTGFAILTNSMVFDETGALYGTKGANGSPSDLISISTQTGVGALIGTTATNNLIGLAYSTSVFTPPADSCKNISLSSAWNMVAVPLHPTNTSTTALFPLATSQVYGFSNGYTAQTNVTTGKGYWVRYPSAATLPVCGTTATGSIDITAGWNMIGVYGAAVAVSGLTTTPSGILNSSFFGFNNGYVQATSLESGKGYWIRAAQSGVLNLPVVVAKSGVEFVQQIEKNWTKIIVTDKIGQQVILYAADRAVANASGFVLPPVPPVGIFDARFASQSLVENVGDAAKIISFSSAIYPVEIRVEGKDLVIRDVATGKLVNSTVKSGSSMVITNENVSSVEVSSIAKPIAYELQQNYPNPFNPSTLIRFSIPENIRVRLTIYNQLGEQVAELVNGEMESGYHQITWNASNMSTGVYFCELKTEKFNSVKKLLLMK